MLIDIKLDTHYLPKFKYSFQNKAEWINLWLIKYVYIKIDFICSLKRNFTKSIFFI